MSLIHIEIENHNVYPMIFACFTIQEYVNQILKIKKSTESKNTDRENKRID